MARRPRLAAETHPLRGQSRGLLRDPEGVAGGAHPGGPGDRVAGAKKGRVMKAADPKSHRPKPTTPCPSCGASGPSCCDSVRWLRGAPCCTACTGTHEEGTPNAAA